MRRPCSGWPGSSNRSGPGRTGYLRFVHNASPQKRQDLTKRSLIGTEESAPGGSGTPIPETRTRSGGLNRGSKRPDRPCAGGHRQHSRPRRKAAANPRRPRSRSNGPWPLRPSPWRLRRSRRMDTPSTVPDRWPRSVSSGRSASTMATTMSTRPSARIPPRSSPARCRREAAIQMVDDRESDARRRFEQLKSEMTGRGAAANLARKDSGEA